MDVFVGRCAMFHVDVCMDMSLGVLCFFAVYMDVSVCAWCLGGCLYVCVGRWVVFWWMYGWICR